MKRAYKKRIIIGAILIFLILIIRYSGIGSYITLKSIKDNRKWLQAIIDKNYWTFVVGYLGAFIATTAVSLPVTMVMTLVGGFFFGTFRGAILANLGATIGSTVSFLLIRNFFGTVLHDRYKIQLKSFNKEFKKYGYNYLLGVHFFMVIPLFVSNILGGLANISLWTHIWTTSIGLIPGTFLFALAGKKLMTIESITEVFSAQFFIALFVLFIISLLPIFIRWSKKARSA
ncbi:TVP38/TMEM64 family protein [bacterium]|nr:TVP38/TMEM64 family protein [bacterium]